MVGTRVGTFIKHEKWAPLQLRTLIAESGGNGLRLGVALASQ